MLDRLFPFGEEAHADYVPFTREAAEEERRAGVRADVVEISYRLSVNGGE